MASPVSSSNPPFPKQPNVKLPAVTALVLGILSIVLLGGAGYGFMIKATWLMGAAVLVGTSFGGSLISTIVALYARSQKQMSQPPAGRPPADETSSDETSTDETSTDDVGLGNAPASPLRQIDLASLTAAFLARFALEYAHLDAHVVQDFEQFLELKPSFRNKTQFTLTLRQPRREGKCTLVVSSAFVSCMMKKDSRSPVPIARITWTNVDPDNERGLIADPKILDWFQRLAKGEAVPPIAAGAPKSEYQVWMLTKIQKNSDSA